ncbi:MAG: hypothetical protein LBL01_07275, partial [Bifidobacteriaceae bacterium]|nr:hypothetical protein [Bifidobacteriaceae bacterium]
MTDQGVAVLIAVQPSARRPAPLPAQIAGLAASVVELPGGGADAKAPVEAALDASPAAVKVVLVPDAARYTAVREVARERADVIAVTTALAAEGAVAALGRGATPAGLVYPPIDSPRRALEQAGLAAEPGPEGRCEVTLSPGGDGPWLRFTEGGVAVRADGLAPLARQAVRERAEAGGPPRPAGGHLLIGRANWAGQGRAWAQAVEDHVPGFTAANFAVRAVSGGTAFEADALVPSYRFMDPVTRLDIAAEYGAPATHVMMEDFGELFLLGGPDAGPASLDGALAEAAHIIASGRRFAALSHGTAGRLPRVNASLYPFSPYAVAHDAATLRDAAQSEAIHALLPELRRLGIPLFTSTPDMLDYFPDAVWLPVVARPEDFAPHPDWAPGSRLRVAHIPSSDSKKG